MSSKVTKMPNRPPPEPRRVTTTYHTNSADPKLIINRGTPSKQSRRTVQMICCDSAEGLLKGKR